MSHLICSIKPKAATKAGASRGWGEGLSAAAPGGGALAQAALKAACISANATPQTVSVCVVLKIEQVSK